MTLHFHAVAASLYALNVLHAANGRGGEVHSAYRRTINLRFPSDQLVSLHGGRDLVAPFGIALGHRFGSSAFEHLAPGLPVVAVAGLLCIPNQELEVALDGTEVWEPKARPRPLGPTDASRHADALTAILLQHENSDGLAALVDAADATPLLRHARPSAIRLAEGLVRRDAAALLAGAAPLLGLGPGLTPSGDDFLAGFLGTAVLAVPDPDFLLGDVGKEVLHLAETRTTLLSRAFLAHALKGALAPPADALAASILEGAGREAVARAAQAASALGHTSGMDTLAGMVFALRNLGRVAP